MEHFVLELIRSASGPYAYGLIFGVLVACGLGFPLPEDVSLITGGFLVYKGHATAPLMLITGFAGILAGDTIVYAIGHWYRNVKGRHPGGLLGRHLTPTRIAKVERQFRERGPVMVLIARFLPGVRAATYFVAGGARMNYGRFILYDAIAALLSAPLFVMAGRHFGAQIEDVVAWAEEFHTILIAGMVIAAVGIVVKLITARGGATEEPEYLHVVKGEDDEARRVG